VEVTSSGQTKATGTLNSGSYRQAKNTCFNAFYNWFINVRNNYGLNGWSLKTRKASRQFVCNRRPCKLTNAVMYAAHHITNRQLLRLMLGLKADQQTHRTEASTSKLQQITYDENQTHVQAIIVKVLTFCSTETRSQKTTCYRSAITDNITFGTPEILAAKRPSNPTLICHHRTWPPPIPL